MRPGVQLGDAPSQCTSVHGHDAPRWGRGGQGWGWLYVGVGSGTQEISVLPTQLCPEPKTILNNTCYSLKL